MGFFWGLVGGLILVGCGILCLPGIIIRKRPEAEPASFPVETATVLSVEQVIVEDNKDSAENTNQDRMVQKENRFANKEHRFTSTIEELLRKRKKILEQIEKDYTKSVTLLFTDIVGSTGFFEKMGDIEGRQMIMTHNDLLFPIIESKGGRIIKTIGDSIMATFEDPTNGVECAIIMQKKLASYNAGRDEKERIRVRMGLHYGIAVIDEKDLFGDMVNTAARVEARAEGEEIIISSALAEKCDPAFYPLIFLGSDTVKGKTKEIGFFLVNWNGRREDEIHSTWESRIKG